MAIPLGTENKRQVYMVAALFGIVALIAAWEIHGAFGSSSTSTPLSTAHNPAKLSSTAGTTQQSRIADLEPKLESDHLTRSESVEYATSGRNIFSVESAPVQIEAPVSPARPVLAVLNTSVPERPKPPTIDLKYLGYLLSNDKAYNALVTHGDDSFVARTGEIVFHYYKVGTIQPSGVQITDLRFNNTQTIAVTEK
ncbi:MAG: hypothetical protein P4L10_05540 [Acidobacteriaceae bacterium]|nr:hypothetical protein [Acidobacteriaceae bacterium]